MVTQEQRAVRGLKAAGWHISEAHLAWLACFERLISQITSRLVSAQKAYLSAEVVRIFSARQPILACECNKVIRIQNYAIFVSFLHHLNV